MVRVDQTGRARVAAVSSARAGYNSLATQYGKSVILTPSYLRAETLMGAAQNNIVFTVNSASSSQVAQNTEKRLAINDAFWVTHIGVFFARLTSSAVGPHGQMILQSFPNDKVWTVAAEFMAMSAAYAGQLNIRVNDTVYVDGIDLLSFWRSDTAQQGQAVSAVATTGVTGASAWEQNRSFKELTPWVLFNGPSTNEVSVKLPESLALGAVAPIQNWAVLICRGFLAQNGGQSRI